MTCDSWNRQGRIGSSVYNSWNIIEEEMVDKEAEEEEEIWWARFGVICSCWRGEREW